MTALPLNTLVCIFYTQGHSPPPPPSNEEVSLSRSYHSVFPLMSTVAKGPVQDPVSHLVVASL